MVTALTVGVGLTVTEYVIDAPGQLYAVGVTVIVAIIGDVVVLVAVNDGTLPEPLAASPIAVLLFVHVNVVPETGPDNVVKGAIALLQNV